jgi:hypothetical protein
MGIDAYDYGVIDGKAIREQEIIKLFEQSDSVCADWAIALIKGETNGTSEQ